MILETTNPKYQTRPQIPAGRKTYIQTQDRSDLEFISDGSRSMARGELQTEHFVDRNPPKWVLDPTSGRHISVQNREPEPAPEPEPRVQSSMWLADEALDAPLWLIIDLHTGYVMARVRGSLTWVVDQMKLAAHQLGGQVQDLYYKRAN